MQVKKQQLKLDMEQWTGSKVGKEYDKALYCHPAHLTSMQSTSHEMPSWMKHKLESRLFIVPLFILLICRVSDVVDISPRYLDSSLWFIQHDISHADNVMLKILLARLQQYMN